MRAPIIAALLGSTMFIANPAFAQDAPSVDERLDRLEALVEGLVERMDRQQAAPAPAPDAAVIAALQAELAETRAQLDAQEDMLVAVQRAPAQQEDKGFRVGDTTISYSGFVKVDAIAQRTSAGQLPSGNIARDFLIPSLIPVGPDGAEGSGFDTDFSARQSRFILKTETDVGAEHNLSSQIELDFMVTNGGDERISNSYVPRLRQAFITYDKWLFGQAWSTFQDVGALPDSLDFIGVTPGTVFARQPMVRYTNGGIQVALEQPETTITSPAGGRVLAGDDSLPDLVARYNLSRDWGGISLAGIGRVLNVREDDFGLIDDSAIGYGISLSGKLNVGERDDFRFMATAGEGLGRYIGLNLVNDAAIDLDGELDPIGTLSGFASFRHFWADELRSTIGGSYFKADNPVLLTGLTPTDESYNAFANLIWSPVAPFDVGIEYMRAWRANEAGDDGVLEKVQVSTKYRF